jgi:hypothetical protein
LDGIENEAGVGGAKEAVFGREELNEKIALEYGAVARKDLLQYDALPSKMALDKDFIADKTGVRMRESDPKEMLSIGDVTEKTALKTSVLTKSESVSKFENCSLRVALGVTVGESEGGGHDSPKQVCSPASS